MLGAGIGSSNNAKTSVVWFPRPPTSSDVELHCYLGEIRQRYRCEDRLVDSMPISAPALVWTTSSLPAREQGKGGCGDGLWVRVRAPEHHHQFGHGVLIL